MVQCGWLCVLHRLPHHENSLLIGALANDLKEEPAFSTHCSAHLSLSVRHAGKTRQMERRKAAMVPKKGKKQIGQIGLDQDLDSDLDP